MLDVTDVPVHRFTSEEYDRMVYAGALDRVRTELLDGLIVDKMTPSPEHVAVINALVRLCAQQLGLVRTQSPVKAAEGWTPEPDFALAPTDPHAHPTSALLAAEVAVTSHAYDRKKVGVYLRAGIPQVWLIDVPGRVVTVVTSDGHEVRRGEDILDPEVEGIAPFTVDGLFETAGL